MCEPNVTGNLSATATVIVNRVLALKPMLRLDFSLNYTESRLLLDSETITQNIYIFSNLAARFNHLR